MQAERQLQQQSSGAAAEPASPSDPGPLEPPPTGGATPDSLRGGAAECPAAAGATDSGGPPVQPDGGDESDQEMEQWLARTLQKVQPGAELTVGSGVLHTAGRADVNSSWRHTARAQSMTGGRGRPLP